MSTSTVMGILVFITLFCGIGSLVLLVYKFVKKQPKKPAAIALASCIALAVLFSVIGATSMTPEEKAVNAEKQAQREAAKLVEQQSKNAAKEKAVASPQPPPKQEIQYDIVSTEKLSQNRLNAIVVIKEPANVEAIKAVTHKVVATLKEKQPFSALHIGLTDYAEYVGSAYTLGTVTYGPKGQIAADTSKKLGTYDHMEYKYAMQEKDWSKRLSQEEATLWKKWYDFYLKERKANQNKKYESIIDDFCTTTNTPAEKANSVINKKDLWLLSNK